jgi:hypothetical protein
MGLPVRFFFAACFISAGLRLSRTSIHRLIPDSIHNPLKGHEEKSGMPQNVGRFSRFSAAFRL